MLQVTYKKHGIRLTHVWFGDLTEIMQITEKNANNSIKTNHAGKTDLYFLHGVDKIEGQQIYTEQKTLIKNLEPDEDVLFLSLGKHLRQYIKRSEKEQAANIRFFRNELINDQVLEECKHLYEKMFADKGSNALFNTSLAKKYKDMAALIISIAYINGKAVGFDAVINDEHDARLWLSAFDFRNEGNDDQVLSRAHQRMDWEMLCYCKRLGIQYFDFGGVNSFTEPNGIAEFKMKFEKDNHITYYNYLVPNTILGKLAYKTYMRNRG